MNAKRAKSSKVSGDKLPITAIIPVLNCAHRMHEHMEKSMEWLSQVAEIIVVDSSSTDNTLDIIKVHAGHLNPRFINHPVGLYASWNRGVSEASNPFIYFSTVGDYIHLDGLKTLLRWIRRLRADVIISPPEFKFESEDVRNETAGITWPIHDVIKELKLTEPKLMDSWTLYDYVLVYLERCILGSSASNIYRRGILEKFPFSDSFMSAGDSAWIIEHNFDARIAIHPKTVSTYLFHIKDWAEDETHQQHGPILRHKFANRALAKSLQNAHEIEPHLAPIIEKFLAHGHEESDDSLAAIHASALDNIIKQQATGFRSLLEKMDIIRLEVDYSRRREVERLQRKKMGVLRLLWPAAVVNRHLRKRLQRKIEAFKATTHAK